MEYAVVQRKSVSVDECNVPLDLQTSVKRRKPKWYGHVTRSSGLAKTVLQVTAQGGRRRGRQRKRWEDNTREWTGLEWNIILRKAENREEWRKLVVKSLVVPQRQPDDGIGEGEGDHWSPSKRKSWKLRKRRMWSPTEI